MTYDSYVVDVFVCCACAIKNNVLISRVSTTDKEFHFQNWFQARLVMEKIYFDKAGRNSYPDFPIVKIPEGYEVKGLAFPGRESTYDCNSQIPTGVHNGRTIYYVFGRYPSGRSSENYPVIDFVICHGDFLNADHNYVHKNKNVKGFGSYGDIMIRDRKMYVAPTPYAIAEGLTGTQTLILPSEVLPDARLKEVGHLVRVESESLIVGYDFDLSKNIIGTKTIKNPESRKEHHFTAYRLIEDVNGAVKIKDKK